MMQFFEQQVLQALGHLVLGGVNSGLLQDARCVDPSLRQQFAKARVSTSSAVSLRLFDLAAIVHGY